MISIARAANRYGPSPLHLGRQAVFFGGQGAFGRFGLGTKIQIPSAIRKVPLAGR
jgi:hypothetical protein